MPAPAYLQNLVNMQSSNRTHDYLAYQDEIRRQKEELERKNKPKGLWDSIGDTLKGAAKGGLKGAVLGTIVAPGIGTALGATMGAGSGGLASSGLMSPQEQKQLAMGAASAALSRGMGSYLSNAGGGLAAATNNNVGNAADTMTESEYWQNPYRAPMQTWGY
jgi:hypothetical protein